MKNSDYLKFFTKKELIDIIEFMDQAVHVRDKQALVETSDNLKHLIPYEYAICNISRLQGSEVTPIDITNISYPAEFLDFYFKNGLELTDPLVQIHYKTFKLNVWSEILGRADKVSKELVNIAGEFGLKEGLTFGIRESRPGIGSFFCLSGSHLKPVQRHLRLFQMVVPHLHQAYMRVLPEKDKRSAPPPDAPRCTPRELEILNHVKEGLTNWDIAAKMNISLNTVKFHLGNIMLKLDAGNRAHAVAKAMDMGIIFF